MSERSSGDERFQCLSIVLQKCIGTDSRLTKDLANTLQDHNVFEREEKLNLIDLVRKKETVTAINKILERVASSEFGFDKFPNYLKDIDEAPEDVVKLVSAVCGENPSNLCLQLVKSWDILTEHEEMLKRHIKDLFPERHPDFALNWPVNFINICTENMHQELRRVLIEIGVLSNEENEGDRPRSHTDTSQTLTSDKLTSIEEQLDGSTQNQYNQDPSEAAPCIDSAFEIITNEEVQHATGPLSSPSEITPVESMDQCRSRAGPEEEHAQELMLVDQDKDFCTDITGPWSSPSEITPVESVDQCRSCAGPEEEHAQDLMLVDQDKDLCTDITLAKDEQNETKTSAMEWDSYKQCTDYSPYHYSTDTGYEPYLPERQPGIQVNPCLQESTTDEKGPSDIEEAEYVRKQRRYERTADKSFETGKNPQILHEMKSSKACKSSLDRSTPEPLSSEQQSENQDNPRVQEKAIDIKKSSELHHAEHVRKQKKETRIDGSINLGNNPQMLDEMKSKTACKKSSSALSGSQQRGATGKEREACNQAQEAKETTVVDVDNTSTTDTEQLFREGSIAPQYSVPQGVGFEDGTMATRLRSRKQSHEGKASIIIHVAVKGISPDEKMCFEENGQVPYVMVQHRNDVYSFVVDRQGLLVYRYCVFHKVHGYRNEFACGERTADVKQKSGPAYIYDEAWFTKRDGVGQLMHLHLPRQRDEVLRSRFLQLELPGWLRQMQLGWWYMVESKDKACTVSQELLQRMLIQWLQDLHDDCKILATLVLVIGFDQRDIQDNLLRNMIENMELTKFDCKFQEIIYRHIQSIFRSRSLELLEKLMLQMFQNACTKMPEWLLAVPLFYLIKENGHMSHDANAHLKEAFLLSKTGNNVTSYLKSVWARMAKEKGTKEYQKCLRSKRTQIERIAHVHPWIVYLYQYLLADEYVIKLIMEESTILQTFELDILLDQFISHLEPATKKSAAKEKHTAILEKLTKHFHSVFSYAEEQKLSSGLTEQERTDSVNSMLKMLRTLSKSLKKTTVVDGNHIIFCIRVASSAARWAYYVTKQSKTIIFAPVEEMVHQILDNTLRNIHSYGVCRQQVDWKFCDALLATRWHPEFGADWKSNVQTTISTCIQKTWQCEPEQYLKFFKEMLETSEISEELMYCFEKMALNCIQKLLQSYQEPTSYVICGLFRKDSPKKMMALFEKLFLDEFAKYESRDENSTMQLLRFAAEWPMSSMFMQTFNNEDALKYLREAKPKFCKIEENCGQFIESLEMGTVSADLLDFIWNHCAKICEFMQNSTSRTEGSITDNLPTLIEKHFQRMERYKTESRQTMAFMNCCTSLRDDGVTVNHSKLKSLYSGISSSPEVQKLFTSEDVENSPGSFCGLSRNDMREFALVESIKASTLFDHLWHEVAKNYKTAKCPNENLSIDWKEALTEIWPAVKNELHNLAISISNGRLSVTIIADRFQFSEGNREKIRKELDLLFRFTQEINGNEFHHTMIKNKIIEQIYNVFEIKKNGLGLKWALNFKEQFELKGDFAALENFPDIEKDAMTLDDVDENILLRFPEELKQLTQMELGYLQSFTAEADLISWLKNTKMTDVTEVKTLYDLVTTSAGENPHETDRITYLLNATQGFAPLLFHLDKVNSLHELMNRCNEVKSNIEKDWKILDRWRDSAHHLQWFAEKESLYGSDQKLCLQKAKEINQCGVYTIGKMQQSHASGPCMLKDSISLAVRLKDNALSCDKTEHKTEEYALHELQDLQSKLMLIAGEEEQGQQDIQQFIDLFSTIKTLGEAFVNLVNAGCMLFSDWTAVVGSSSFKTKERRNEHNLSVTIRFMKKSMPLSGSVTLYLLQDLARALRETFKEWADFIASKRLQHYYLNEYSIQQITYLCHELAITHNLALLPDQVLALLSKDILVAGAIQDALEEAIKIEDKVENQVEEEGEELIEEVTLTDLEKKKRSIRILVNRERMEEDLAKAAVQAVGFDDIEECNNWALLNQFETELVASNLKIYEDENECALQSNQEEELTSLLQNRSVRSLTEMIDQILTATQNDEATPIVGAVKSICQRYLKRTSVLTLQDYLSLEHLGRFLTILHGKYEVQKIADRSMVPALQPRNPNLVVCPEAETLPLLLSLYMKDPMQPLPTTSEVLLCSESTSCDEVERFMRRAMCKCRTNGKPIFCMAFTDKLKFKVSRAVEDIFNDLIKRNKHINDDYQLVILTCSAAHYISGLFEKYQIPKWQSCSDVDEISRYLKNHLTASHNVNDESSLVKIVTSSRSGVGKSLFVNKLRGRLNTRWYEDFDSIPAILKILGRNDADSGTPQRQLPGPLKSGEPNLILCGNKIAPLLISLYMRDPTQPLPTATEVLLCSHETTEDEVERFMRRALSQQHHEARPIYVMAYTHRLRPLLAEKVEEMYMALSINIHARKDFQLILLSPTVGAFDWCKMFQASSDNTVIDAAEVSIYLDRKQVPEGLKVAFEKATLSDPEKKKLVLRRLIKREKVDEVVAKAAVQANGYDDIKRCIAWALQNESDKKLVQATLDEHTEINTEENVDKASSAGQNSSLTWHKTTIRLLERSVDTNHVLKRLYREEHFRNEHRHFIHIDLTPAVENGIERFMFNLLVLGSIQDDAGRVWNRQSQHLYVIEMTKSSLNKVQILKNSILNLLPCIHCLSPAESMEKYKRVRDKTSSILREVAASLDDQTQLESIGLLRHLSDAEQYKLQDYFHQERLPQEETMPHSHQVLQFGNIPDSVIPHIIEILSNDFLIRIEAVYSEENLANVQLMDFREFLSTAFQRPYQYLKHAEMQDINLDEFQYRRPVGIPSDCIEVLQKRYGSFNPSWAQLRHFTTFLNLQLQNCEESIFCQRIEQKGRESTSWQHTELEGLKKFAVHFMIRMAQDFATPSLDISDQSSKDTDDDEEEVLKTHQIRRKWEEKCHPYLFFNEDRMSMSFINVSLNKRGDLLDENGQVLEKSVASKSLMQGLAAQGIEFGFNFEKFSREDKLDKLCTIMGLPPCLEDPDPTYELTTENVLKILAIYMRLRCNIPVIVMGETGCGKTRMVEFMSKLRARGRKDVRNMVTLKIHGGIIAEHIYNSVKKANNIAQSNREGGIGTVIFYDEANTTTAIHAIKEVICDSTIDGESFHDSQLQIVAACNPYKCLSKKAIEKMESLGLGYRIAASETSNCLGTIPMRRLVYKVVALPPSMQPFVWDFGQLSITAEQKYINQMTLHLQKELGLASHDKDLIDFLFFRAQSYMKDLVDECRYVSLRDVERCMKFFQFFHGLIKFLSPKIDKKLSQLYKGRRLLPEKSGILRCLIQTLGVCYHVSLDNRKDFRQHISGSLAERPIHLSESEINDEIICCQEVFLDNIKIAPNIAPNEALRENVYLITICLQLRIPLFLVGKPGSSKSLAKSIVADNMEGIRSKSPLYRQLKQIHVISYQCSALTDADGIEKIFNKASEFQKGKTLTEFTAVVVLDEIGLAEDSPNMPLKILHPLLECGSTVSGTIADTTPNEKVGFVGISNWALDPAKMNRGIFLTRSTPSEDDLLATAISIMKKSMRIMEEEKEMLESFTKTYLKIYDAQRQLGSKEYFGLRDYYSLIKMVNSKSEDKETSEYQDVAHAVQRNFSGGRQSHFEDFTMPLMKIGDNYRMATIQEMIKENLEETNTRFLLLLTSQHSSVSLLEHIIASFHDRVQVIYGSGFPGDQTYTEICRNINRIKVCMETGRTVVLLDMTEVHESLYDALNQHYTTYGGQRYVDIGLGGHRLKCRIAENFRLIVMEQKDVVYQQYPIPLVNRLEKHHLVSSCLLSKSQAALSDCLSTWAKDFSKFGKFCEQDAFIGFNDDTVSSIVLSQHRPEDVEPCKEVLLQAATVDAVFRFLNKFAVAEKDNLLVLYTETQVHDSLLSLLNHQIRHSHKNLSLTEVTSFSNILTETDRKRIAGFLKLPEKCITLLSLQQFDTQQEYLTRLERFFSNAEEDTKLTLKLLLIQCPQAHQQGSLLSCAKYCLMNMIKKVKPKSGRKIIVTFLYSTQRQHSHHGDKKLILQHARGSQIVFVDDLRPPSASNTTVSRFYGKSITDVLRMGSEEINQQKVGQEHGINFLGMLKDTICQAIAKVKRGDKTEKRNLCCIELLTTMCRQNGWIEREFATQLAKRMSDIYRSKEESVTHVSKESWIIQESSSAENLQEGGTFGKTLCLCLKRHLADLLAFCISAIDENNNLNFLFTKEQSVECSWKVTLWLQLFGVFTLDWNQMKDLHEFQVTFASHLPENHSPQFPFSFALNSEMKQHWLCEEDWSMKRFCFFVRENKYAPVITKALEVNGPEMVQLYAADLIRCCHDFGNLGEEDYEMLTSILLAVSRKLTAESVGKNEVGEQDSLSLVYYCYREHFKYLEMLSEIFKVQAGISSKTNEWLEKQNEADHFIIHALAMMDLLDWVAAYKIDDNVSCIKWMELTDKCKKILNHGLIEQESYKQVIFRKWKPISLLDLLLLRLLPSNGSISFTNYVDVVVTHAKRLLKPLQKYGFCDKNFLRIVLNVLRKSYEDIKMKILVSWQDLICKMCKKAFIDPIKLPCGHFICTDCTERMFAAADTRRQCPVCPTSIPQDFKRDIATLTDNEEKESSMFRANCTSFFLEYLSQFCFSSAESGVDDHIELFLHEFVMGVPATGERMELENLAIDLNIITRANIFQLLLRHDPVLVENKINEQLSSNVLKAEQVENLIVVILSGFESKIEQCDSWKSFQENLKNIRNSSGTTLNSLQLLANVRYFLQNSIAATKEEDLSPELFATIGTCAKDETLRTYVVKVGCQQFGTDWFRYIYNHRCLRDLVPALLQETAHNKCIDYWLLLGDHYNELRQKLNKISLEDWRSQMPGFFPPGGSKKEMMLKILAVENHKEHHYFSRLREHLSEMNAGSESLITIIQALKKVKIPEVSTVQDSALRQLIVLANCIVMCEPYMMENFLLICTEPNKATNLFWPAMPVSMFFSVREVLANETNIAAYRCPNGHLYMIGECTMPYYEATCPECGETIGGRHHTAARGNEKVEHDEQAEKGYKLNSDTIGKDDPCDRMSKQGVAVVHFVLHSCMLMGLRHEVNTVCGMLQKELEDEAEAYLYKEIQNNIEDFSNALGRNYDDTLMALHACLRSIIDRGFDVDRNGHDWTTMGERETWEDEFRRHYLLPVFQELDDVIMNAQRTINDAEDLNGMMLYRIMHEIQTEEEPRELRWNHPMLWKTIKHSNTAHLLQTIRDSASTGGVLKIMLEFPNLHLLQHLNAVLSLQRAMISKYQNRVDLKVTESTTFRHYEQELDRHSNNLLVEHYIKLWNSIYQIFNKGSAKQVKEHLHPINEDTPITMALPSTRGRGRCAKLLAEYLIDIHNNFLENCSTALKTVQSASEVDVSQLRESDCICIDKQAHLLGMIRMDTSYKITRDSHGCHHHITYNIDALEKKVREKYVIYKPRIKKKSLPCIKYPQDIGIGSDWDKVVAHILQEPLSNKLVQEVDGIVNNQHVTAADVCEGVRTLTHAICFLAKIKVNERMPLQKYLEDTLLLSPNHMAMIPKTALVCHALALYQHLMWHKAVNFVQQGLNPYQEALNEVDQVEITEGDVLRQLKEAFDHMDMAVLQQRLNEMLIRVPDFNPDWSLKEIFPDFRFIDDDPSEAWFERLPKELCFKHVSHLFQLSVKGVKLPEVNATA